MKNAELMLYLVCVFLGMFSLVPVLPRFHKFSLENQVKNLRFRDVGFRFFLLKG